MAQTGYSNLAKQVNDADRFVLVEQLDNSEVESWLRRYGISKEEAALIQPSYGGFVIERISYSLLDIILSVVSLLASLAILAIVVIALKLSLNKTLPKPQRRKHFLIMATTSVLIVTGFVFYLPNPKKAVEVLSGGAIGRETITCEGFNTPKNERPNACNEFDQNGINSGWRKVPCKGICML